MSCIPRGNSLEKISYTRTKDLVHSNKRSRTLEQKISYTRTKDLVHSNKRSRKDQKIKKKRSKNQ